MITEPPADLSEILKQIDVAQEAAARPTWARGEEAMFDEDRQDDEFVRLLWTTWPTIRGALERQAELGRENEQLVEQVARWQHGVTDLEAALRRMVAAVDLDDDLREAYNEAKALLGEPAANAPDNSR